MTNDPTTANRWPGPSRSPTNRRSSTTCRNARAPRTGNIFITDGELHDLEEVEQYSIKLARAVAPGKRNPLKFVLIGVSDDVNEKQMEALDDLDLGTDIDLWDHKLAAEIRVLEQIFAEVVDRNPRVSPTGRVLTPDGKVVRDFSDTGVPALLEFEMPAGSKYFTLEVPGHRIHQALSDSAVIPVNEETTVAEKKCAGGDAQRLASEFSRSTSAPGR